VKRRDSRLILAGTVVWATAAAWAGDPGVWPTSGWATATPAEMGLDESKLFEARDYALTGGGAGLITRGGKVVLAWGNTAQRRDVKSTTKSIGVTILGIALEDGLVSLSDAAQLHLPDAGTPPPSNQQTGWLDDITLEHLATHAAGFEKEGGFGDLWFEPGTMWAYSDGGANWLADVLTIVYGQDLATVLSARVLGPLGVTAADLTWRSNLYRGSTIQGIPRREFGAGISVNADAMARIGYLYLRGGVWDGERIVGQGFVSAASRPAPSVVGLPVYAALEYFDASDHYGLLWWNNGDGSLPEVPTDAFWSWGLGDSLIVVIPSLDIVVARNGTGWRTNWTADYDVLAPFLTPIAEAVNGPSPLDDLDGDGVIAASDCDDGNASTYPGASEVNDGQDNQCPGDYGHGATDETGSDSSFEDRTLWTWPPQPGATAYEVARSTSPRFEAGTCVVAATSGGSWHATEAPAAGFAFFYLNRPASPHAGDWGPGRPTGLCE
jgi:CubicO group peptidase (beta-lactamase class C family)